MVVVLMMMIMAELVLWPGKGGLKEARYKLRVAGWRVEGGGWRMEDGRMS